MKIDLDPIKVKEGISYMVLGHVCDRLVRYDENLNIVPSLVESWVVSNDGLRYEFKLRDDVRFHNGQKITSRDVAWSLQRLLSKGSIKYHELKYIKGAQEYYSGSNRVVRGITIESPTTVAVELMQPYPPILSIMASPGSEILPENSINKNGEIVSDLFVCSGPFRVVRKDADALVLESFKEYYQPADRVDELIFRFLDKPDAINCFEAGKCHDMRWYFVGSKDVGVDHKVERHPVAHVNIIAFNTKRYPFNKVEVRQAIAMAIDRKRLLDICYPDKEQPHGYIPPGLGGYDSDAKELPYNPMVAKNLLLKAKLSDVDLSKTYELLRMSNYMCPLKYKDYIESALAKVGLKVKVRYVNPNDFVNKYLSVGKYDMANFTMTSDYSEAYFLLNYFRSDYPSNYTAIDDKIIDGWLDKSMSTSNRYERYKIYRNIQDRILELLPVINMYHDIWTTLYRSEVEGYRNTNLSIYNTSLRNVRVSNK